MSPPPGRDATRPQKIAPPEGVDRVSAAYANHPDFVTGTVPRPVHFRFSPQLVEVPIPAGPAADLHLLLQIDSTAENTFWLGRPRVIGPGASFSLLALGPPRWCPQFIRSAVWTTR